MSSNDTPLLGAPPLGGSRAESDFAPWFAIGVVVFWVAVMGVANPAQFADSIEQYNWAHSLEWGYWKHPPLSTWLMRGAIEAIGASHWTSYLLAALCLSGTAFFTWRIGAMLLPPRAAALAMVLWPLHNGFSWRANIYNHNTVLVLASGAMVWAALRAARSKRERDWAVFGLCTGLAFLAKYQAAVPLAAVLWGLWRTGALRERSARWHLALAAAVALLVGLPHALWALSQGLPTLSYLRSSATVDVMTRVPSLLRFFASQVPWLVAMLAAAVALYFWPGHAKARRVQAGRPNDRPDPWVVILVAGPLIGLGVVVLVSGWESQRAWGLQTLQFLPLWLAWRLDRSRPGVPLAVPAFAGLLVSLVGGGFVAREAIDANSVAHLHTVDRLMPARDLARAAARDWHEATGCPLRYVVGPSFVAGLVSVYSGEYPAVVEDGDYRKSPWVKRDNVAREGALVVSGPHGLSILPPQSKHMLVPARTSDGGRAAVAWEVLPPAHPCSIG